jgi:enterochelin esterase-like enzyme
MQKIISTLLVTFIAVAGLAQTGKVFDALGVKSNILKMDRKYAIYLPPDYESSQRSYPVLYLLHGAGDDQTGWVQFGEVLRIADKSVVDGSATPMIIVMPDANTERRGYFNALDGEWNYEDFFFEEFMPYIEKTYRIKAEKRYRAIAGLSMGGGGTFVYALHHPELFSSACPLSAAAGPVNKERAIKYMNGWRDVENIYSDEQIEEYMNTYSAIRMMETKPEKEIRSVRWYIDCGDDDFLFESNSLIHITMKKRKIVHEYRVRDGAHNWTYWRESLPEVLKFVSMKFHQY